MTSTFMLERLDQVQEMCSERFQQILKVIKRKKYLWENIRFYYQTFELESWDILMDLTRRLSNKGSQLLNTS